jgi:hypothetical protein
MYAITASNSDGTATAAEPGLVVAGEVDPPGPVVVAPTVETTTSDVATAAPVIVLLPSVVYEPKKTNKQNTLN